MDKKQVAGYVVNQPYGHRLHATLLWLLSAMAAILLNFQTIAYAADDSAGSSHKGQPLIVKNWKGEYLGTSHHVVMDPSGGSIVFVIVSLETAENKEIAIPWVLFSVDKENGDLMLSISKKQLDSAPEYHASSLKDPEFVRRIYYFFASVSLRTEETPKAKRMSLESF